MTTAKSTTQEQEDAPPGRATCYSCFRPAALCCCAELPRIDNRTRVVLLQHPRERFHPVGTARLVQGSLSRCELLSAPLRTLGQTVAALQLPEDTALLFPSRDAVDLGELPAAERPSCIVVLDGTWHQAKTLLRDLPQLANLRRVRFSPDEPSNYRIRKEPQESYLSTLESVAHVLARLEPELDVAPLHEIFRSMIDRNIAARRPGEREGRRRFRGRGRAYQLPVALRAPLAEQVLVYAESTRLEGKSSPRLPLVVRALHPDSGRELEVLVRHDEAEREDLLAHLGHTPGEYRRAALGELEARDVVRQFVQDRRWVSFHPSSLRWLGQLGLQAPHSLETPSLSLKNAYCDLSRARDEVPEQWGSLDRILERLGRPQALGAPRAALRLRQTLALFEYLREQLDN